MFNFKIDSKNLFILNFIIFVLFYFLYFFQTIEYTNTLSISFFSDSVSVDLIEYYFYGEILLKDFNFIFSEFKNYYFNNLKTDYILPPLFPIILYSLNYFDNIVTFNFINIILSGFIFYLINKPLLVFQKKINFIELLLIQLIIFNPYLWFTFFNFNVDTIFILLMTIIIINCWKKFNDNKLINNNYILLLVLICALIKSNSICLILFLVYFYFFTNKKYFYIYLFLLIIFSLLYLPYFDRYTNNAYNNRLFLGYSPNYYINLKILFSDPILYLKHSLISIFVNFINLLGIYETQSGSNFRFMRYLYSPVILFTIFLIFLYKKNNFPKIVLISFYLPLFLGNPMPRYLLPIIILPILILYYESRFLRKLF